MRQIFEKRYLPDCVRAFHWHDSVYCLVAPESYFMSDDYMCDVAELSSLGIELDVMIDSDINYQLEFPLKMDMEEVIL